MDVKGVFFPQLVDPDIPEGSLPFNFVLVERTIFSIDNPPNDPNAPIPVEPLTQALSDIVGAIINNPFDQEIAEDGLFPLDTGGMVYEGSDISDLAHGTIGLNFSLSMDKKWTSELTQAMFEQAVIQSVKQTGFDNIILKFI